MVTHTVLLQDCGDQPGKVANPARGQLNRENEYFPRSRLRIWSRETGSTVSSLVPRQPAHLLTQVESGSYPGTYYGIPPEFRGRRPFIYLNRHNTPSGQSRVYRVMQYCVPMTFTAESPPAQGQ